MCKVPAKNLYFSCPSGRRENLLLSEDHYPKPEGDARQSWNLTTHSKRTRAKSARAG
jgi:hypothetical protein